MQDLSQMSTEELLRMRNAAQQGGMPAPSRAPGVIRGPQAAPEVVSPADQQRLAFEAERLRLAQEKAAMEATEFQQKQSKQDAAIPRDMDDVRAELLGVIEKAGKARRLSNEWFATGFGAETAGQFGGTAATDVQKLLDTIGGNIAFDRLSRMRAESPTGGALGNVTERELALLQSTISSLDKAQSDVQFQQSMDDVIRSYGRVLAKLPGTDPNEILQSQFDAGASEAELTALAEGLGVNLADIEAVRENLRRREEGLPTGSFFSGDQPPGGGAGGQFMAGLAQGTGDIAQGIGDTIGVVTDPFARLLADALGYDGSQMQSLGTNVREGLGLPQSPEGMTRSINEFAAGGLLGGVAARSMGALASPGVTQRVLQTVGRTPIRDTAAAAGAGGGASIGEDIGGTPGQVVGILAGGLGAGSLANRLASASGGSVPNALAQAAARQNIDLLPADAGGPVARAVTTGTRASPVSVGPVVAAAERQQQQFGQAVRRTAASQGEVLDTQAAGEAIKRGGGEFIEQSRQRGNRLYERAAQQARGVRIKPTQTVAAGRQAIARLRENPAATPAEIGALETFLANIEGGVTIQGLRDARTKLSESVYDGGLRSSSDQAMWKGILGNVADDIDAGLRSVGREDAANTFRVADRLWSERIDVIDKTLAPIIGKDGAKGGEQVLQAIETMARGGSGGNLRLSKLMAALPEAEAGNVRATLIDRLGRATPGAQDAQGEVFSAATFLTNWNRMTPQAKVSLFPDKAARDNLNDLAKIADQTKRSQAMANTSNTGVAVTSANLIAGVGGAAANLPATLIAGGSVYLTGKLMASPEFARLLARTSKMPPEAANRTFMEQLGVLSTRNPALSGDVDNLMRAMNDNASGALAAEEQNP